MRGAEGARADGLQSQVDAERTMRGAEKARADAEKARADEERTMRGAEKARADAEKARADALQAQVDAAKSKEVVTETMAKIVQLTRAFSSHNYGHMVSIIEGMDSVARREGFSILQSMLEGVRDVGAVETFRDTLVAVVVEASMSTIRGEFQEVFNSLTLPEGIDPSIVDMSDMAGVPQETDTAFGAETTSSGADEGMPDLAGSDDIYGSNDLDGTS